jgi:hypothetical protein
MKFSALCTFTFDVWGAKGGPYLQLILFGFGIGSAITPQLAKPFLPPKKRLQMSTANNTSPAASMFPLQDMPGR